LFTAGGVRFRRASEGDVSGIVALLTDDVLGSAREGTDLRPYHRAFAAIDSDPGQLLVVGESTSDDSSSSSIVATFQLSFIPCMSRNGALRAQIEAVRVSSGLRGNGVGSVMMEWAIGEARRRNCALVQLSSDKSRRDAHRFYEKLGFKAGAEGMKLFL
jgi:GNAT superfamily N-acetyltransferase